MADEPVSSEKLGSLRDAHVNGNGAATVLRTSSNRESYASETDDGEAITSTDRPAPTPASQLQANFQRLLRQNEQLLVALKEAATHVEHVEHVPQDIKYHEEKRRKDDYKRIWEEEILQHRVNADPQASSSSGSPESQAAQSSMQRDLRDSYVLKRNGSLKDMLSAKYLWNQKVYKLAYTRLSKFMDTLDFKSGSISEVSYDDFELDVWEIIQRKRNDLKRREEQVNKGRGDLSMDVDELQRDSTRQGGRRTNCQSISGEENEQEAEAKWKKVEPIRKKLNHNELWSKLKERGTASETESLSSQDRSSKVPVRSRLLHITDISPIVALILLGTSPRLNLTYVALFLERYLSFSNWATANFLSIKSHGRINTYHFEYHLAFFFVPPIEMDPELAAKDFRRVRHSAPCGRAGRKCQYIYEEQLSFMLVGHGRDVYTCYQLGENYFVGPYLKSSSTLFINRHRHTPSSLFLSWISMALHHVVFRWHNVIAAVDALIDSPFQVIFLEDNPDLLSDDPSFTRSKTYFWAIQAYHLFEERLKDTIITWEKFKRVSLDKINDNSMSPEEWDQAVLAIEIGIERLRNSVEIVRKKSKEVVRLRDGLYGASSLFDSRIAVRQGDNIRLLTYITILFLPLTFCTSIFGMQVVLPNNLPMYTFAFTLPAVTLFTALLIMNLGNIVDYWEWFFQGATSTMRKFMEKHPRRNWQERAARLHEDRKARQAPIKKRKRQSSHWMYLLFLFDFLLVSVPVAEVKEAMRLYGVLRSLKRGKEGSGAPSRASLVRKYMKNTKLFWLDDEIVHPVHLGWKGHPIANVIFCALRFILSLILWLPLIAVEYIILLPFFVLSWIFCTRAIPGHPVTLGTSPAAPAASANSQKQQSPRTGAHITQTQSHETAWPPLWKRPLTLLGFFRQPTQTAKEHWDNFRSRTFQHPHLPHPHLHGLNHHHSSPSSTMTMHGFPLRPRLGRSQAYVSRQGQTGMTAAPVRSPSPAPPRPIGRTQSGLRGPNNPLGGNTATWIFPPPRRTRTSRWRRASILGGRRDEEVALEVLEEGQADGLGVQGKAEGG